MQRRWKLVIAAALILGGAGLVLAGTAPKALDTVTSAAAKPVGASFEVRGVIKAGSVNRSSSESFVVTDGTTNLLVRPETPLPANESGPLDGRVVLISGIVRAGPTGVYLDASSLQIGCPSKYKTA
ncbi:MAG: cytochrome c maturation protein CcmE domain-containing protein [Thermoplasmatota archaeon]